MNRVVSLLFRLGLSEVIIQTCVLALILYIAALVILRLGDKRFLGKNAAFDFIVGIVIGSTVSRAINGSAELIPTISAVIVLVGFHWLIATISIHSNKIDSLVKGKSELIAKDGNILWDVMKKNHISKNDLMMHVRFDGNVTKIEDVEEAFFEKGGRISIIPKKPESKKLHIIDIEVKEGVQTVRISIE